MKTDRKILSYEQATKKARLLHSEGKLIVLTSGCYDLLHLGHIKHLEYCRAKGDVLIVNIGNDLTIRALKGPDRPVFTEAVRSRMLAALECVDLVVISEEHGKMDHIDLVRLVRPDIYVVNRTDSHLKEKEELIKETGGRLIACHRVAPPHARGISTTAITKRLPQR